MQKLTFIIIVSSIFTAAQDRSDSLRYLISENSDSLKVEQMLELAEVYGAEEIDKMISTAAEAAELSRNIDYHRGSLKANLLLGLAEYYKNNFNLALINYFEAYDNYYDYGAADLRGRLLINIGNAFDAMGEYDTAFYYHIRSVEVLEKTDDKRLKAFAYANVGLEYMRWNKYSDALKYQLKALEYREELGIPEEIVTTLNNVGVLYWNLGKYEQALDYYQRSYRYVIDLHDDVHRALVSNNIGLIYLDIDKPELAEEYFFEGLTAALEADDNGSISYSCQNLGLLHKRKGNLDSALYYYYTAKDMVTGTAWGKFSEIQLINSIGNVFKEKKEYRDALENFQRALGKSSNLNYSSGQGESLRYLGDTYRLLGNFTTAESYLLGALDIFKDTEMIAEIKDCFFSLYQLYSDKGDYQKALTHYQEFISIRDSLFNKVSNEKLAELQLRFEAEKKELENENLKSEIESETDLRNSFILISLLAVLALGLIYSRFRSKSKLQKHTLEQKQKVEKLNRKLGELNRTKDKFFSIISHDLRTPFNAILGYADLVENSYENLSEDEKQMVGTNLKNAAVLTYELLENLLKWSRTQRGILQYKPETVNLKQLSVDAVSHLKNPLNKKRLELINAIPENIIVNADRNMVMTVFRNLVSNAIKFSEKGGKIELSAEKQNGTVKICVRDEGIGIEQDKIGQLFTLDDDRVRHGTDGESGTGLGLVLCSDFVKRHDGDITVTSKKGEGAVFCFTLPAAGD